MTTTDDPLEATNGCKAVLVKAINDGHRIEMHCQLEAGHDQEVSVRQCERHGPECSLNVGAHRATPHRLVVEWRDA